MMNGRNERLMFKCWTHVRYYLWPVCECFPEFGLLAFYSIFSSRCEAEGQLTMYKCYLHAHPAH